MHVEQTSGSQDLSTLGETSNRSLRIIPESPVATLVQLPTSPSGGRVRRSPPDLDRMEHLRLPSHSSPASNPRQNQTRRSGGSDCDSPCLETEGLVRPSHSDGMRDPVETTNLHGSALPEAAGQGHPVPHGPVLTTSSSLEIERQSLTSAGLSQEVITTSLTCLRKSSRTLYATRWDKYSSFCAKRHIDPVSAPVSIVLDFLQELATTVSVSAIRGYIMAISCTHQQVEHMKLSYHPLVKNWLT